MNILCDLCSGDDLEIIYTPPTTKRGLAVYICSFCGLMQSIPRIDHVENKEVTTSSGADWGNVRYGKQFDVDEAVEILSGVLDKDATNRVLDIGAGRNADFLKALEKWNPMLMCYGVEPHFEFGYQDDYDDFIIRWKERFEDCNLEDNWVDAITFIHTLEHLKSPREALKKAYAALKDWGWLLVIVPNMEYLLEQKDIVEELFIDKHLYHFAPTTLAKYFYDTGFGITESRYSNRETTVYLGQKRPLSDSVRKTVRDYGTRLESNIHNLPKAADKINEMQDVAVWGAGRVLDALVEAGLDMHKIGYLIDSYIPQSIINDRMIFRPKDILRHWKTYNIIICSREYADEIKAEAKELCPNAATVVWSDLL